MIFFLLMAVAALSAAGQISPKTAELGWLELPSFSEDPEHFFVSHHTEEYWGKQRNYSLFWDHERQIPLWVAYSLNQRLIGKGKRSGAWQYDKFMATKKQPNLRRTYQAGSVEGYIRGHLCPSNDRMRPGIGRIKLTVGIVRRTLEKVQYCITALESECVKKKKASKKDA